MSIVITVVDSAGKLAQIKPVILDVSYNAVEKISKKLSIQNLDMVFYENKTGTIPHLGIGGYTVTNNVINICINSSFRNIRSSIVKNLPETIAHEMHHAKMKYSGETIRTLLEAMIYEGLADHFSIEMFGNKPPAWDRALTKNQLKQLVSSSKNEWKNTNYDHNAWFFGSKEKNIPKWTAYSIGFHLVRNYLKKTGKKPSEINKINLSKFV